MSRAKLIELSRRALDGDEAAVASLRTEDVDVPDEGFTESAHRTVSTRLSERPCVFLSRSLKAGFKAYHASPYRFTAFDNEKIGRGEGAQAYGEGSYLTDEPLIQRDLLEEISTEIDSKISMTALVKSQKNYPSTKLLECTGNSTIQKDLSLLVNMIG